MPAALTLASQSPRRAELLRQLGVPFHVQPAQIDETQQPGEAPQDYVERMATAKAAAVGARGAGPVLGADTTVVIDGDSLGKPVDASQARAMLSRLSGRSHRVFTAVSLLAGGCSTLRRVETLVQFCVLPPALIDAYVASGEPFDKAGSYAIQGLAGAFVRRIEGSYTNVVGLPLVETRWLLEEAGIATGLEAGDRCA